MKLLVLLAGLAAVASADNLGQACGSFSNCGDCTFANKGGNDLCYWCHTEKSCVAAKKFEEFSLEECRSVSFDQGECAAASRVKSVLQMATGTVSPREMNTLSPVEIAEEKKPTQQPFKLPATSKPRVVTPPPTKRATAAPYKPATKPPVEPTQPPPPPAARTCQELGWEVEVSGSCGDSKVDKGECPVEIGYNFNGAKNMCSRIGARLCESWELSADIGADTGCGADRELTWTNTQCQGGHFAQAAESAFSLSVKALGQQCVSNSQKLKVRCCADQPGYVATFDKPPPSTCGKLGWNTAPGRPDVCAQSEVDGECFPSVDFATAEGLCGSEGARLCSKEELANGEAADSGCKMDGVRVWSSSTCFGGVSTLAGSYKFEDEVPEECTNRKSRAGLRCCADQPNARRSSCADLGWGFHGEGEKLGVCAESKISGDCALGELSQSAAVARCASTGARLCTRAELERDVAVSTGCKMDTELVWSATGCGQGSFWAVGGATVGKQAPQCLSADTSLSGRCCADV